MKESINLRMGFYQESATYIDLTRSWIDPEIGQFEHLVKQCFPSLPNFLKNISRKTTLKKFR